MTSEISFRGNFKVGFPKYQYQKDNIAEIAEKIYKRKMGTIEKDVSSKIVLYFNIKDKFDKKVARMFKEKNIPFGYKSYSELTSPKEILKRMVVNKYFGDDVKLVNIDIRKFNKVFKKNYFSYIGDKGEVPINTLNGFEEFLKTGKTIDSSVVCVKDAGNHPIVDFYDGRHRYAYYRDIGIKALPVTMDESSIKIAQKYGLLSYKR